MHVISRFNAQICVWQQNIPLKVQNIKQSLSWKWLADVGGFCPQEIEFQREQKKFRVLLCKLHLLSLLLCFFFPLFFFFEIYFCCRKNVKTKNKQTKKRLWIKWEWAHVEVMAQVMLIPLLWTEYPWYSANISTSHWQQNWLFEQSLLLSVEALAAGQGFPTKAK